MKRIIGPRKDSKPWTNEGRRGYPLPFICEADYSRTGPFRGNFADWKETERHGDFVVMTDGFVFRVYIELDKTFIWGCASERKCIQYAKAQCKRAKLFEHRG